MSRVGSGQRFVGHRPVADESEKAVVEPEPQPERNWGEYAWRSESSTLLPLCGRNDR